MTFKTEIIGENPNLNFNVYLKLNEITLDEINNENFDKYDVDVVEYISRYVVKVLEYASLAIHVLNLSLSVPTIKIQNII